MIQLLTYPDIDPQQWQALVNHSPYATWFQTPEAYEFYASLPEEMMPFALGIEENGHLAGVIVGYTTQEKNPIKQLLTCRSIIIGGPLLDEHISDEALSALLGAVAPASRLSPFASRLMKPIYIETRNFHDYSRWKEVFQYSGFAYQPHLNFHVDTSSMELVESRLGKNRKRDIKTSLRDGAMIIEHPTIEQVRSYYALLKHLYTTKIKTPLFSWDFFEKLHAHPNGRFILVELNGEIIGGTVCVVLPNKCIYEWFVCGRDGEWKSIFPSSLATYAGIRYAAEHGCSRFDMMGAGKPDEAYGVRDFKARFGGELVEHGRFLCVRKPLLYWIGKMGVKLLKKR
ncbi:MAG: GNAT family N-acetyltransferase [Paludibacteraceae bacterium]|nr:GNAT family N-acetyltransferase [Paludibacteraceae bacterium]